MNADAVLTICCLPPAAYLTWCWLAYLARCDERTAV
jgi:hypothetical protein